MRRSPRSLVQEPSPRAEGGGERERRSPKQLLAPVTEPAALAISCWQEQRPRAQHAWGP